MLCHLLKHGRGVKSATHARKRSALPRRGRPPGSVSLCGRLSACIPHLSRLHATRRGSLSGRLSLMSQAAVAFSATALASPCASHQDRIQGELGLTASAGVAQSSSSPRSRATSENQMPSSAFRKGCRDLPHSRCRSSACGAWAQTAPRFRALSLKTFGDLARANEDWHT